MTSSSALRRSWCVIDPAALRHNLLTLRTAMPSPTLMAPVVKSNAYGHGAIICSAAFIEAGADWLCVDSLHEVHDLRQAGFQVPILVLGHLPPHDAADAVALGCRAVAYDGAQLEALARAAQARGTVFPIHIKVETGTHRQGLAAPDALALARAIAQNPSLRLEGISTHFANVEDTTDHRYAQEQLQRFAAIADALTAQGTPPEIRSIANSAATLLWPHAHFELTRPGIACYGMWPSKETLLSAVLVGRQHLHLRPALTWTTRLAQVKEVPVGAFIGYGCTYQCTHPTRIGVIPVGYYDGYDRALSNLAHVLVHGQRAPLRGRICMNMAMVDLTDIPQAHAGDEVVLLGPQGDASISAETLAEWAGTINYEITTRIHEGIPRIARQEASP